MDGTVGCGGHAEQILRRLDSRGRLLAADWDGEALEIAKQRLAPYRGRVSFYRSSFAEAPSLLQRAGVQGFSGILLDLGLSSLQLSAARGFSFREKAPLDMRMDGSRRRTAAEIVNGWPVEKLERLLREYGEERSARRIARGLVRQRPFTDTAELAAAVAKGAGGRHGRIHPATRTFQALRLAVNGELDELGRFLRVAPGLLCAGGRLVIIAFESLMDRIVKQYLRGEGADFFKMLTRKPIRPGREESRENRRARSAKLRAAERL